MGNVQLAFIGGIGATELLVIGGIAFLLFGTKRLPEAGKGLATAIREFRKGLRSATEEEPVKEEKEKETPKAV